MITGQSHYEVLDECRFGIKCDEHTHYDTEQRKQLKLETITRQTYK